MTKKKYHGVLRQLSYAAIIFLYIFRYFLLFCLLLKSFGLKRTRSTKLFYGVGRGEHTALVPSVRGNREHGGTQNAVTAHVMTGIAPSHFPFSSPEPLVFRLKMSLTSGSGRAKKFEFFHWLTKNERAAEIKITKYYAFHFTSGPHSAGEQPRA